MTTGGIPIPDPDFVTHTLVTFDNLTEWPSGAWDRDQALVRHVLNLLATWGWAGEVLEQIDRERAGP